MSIAGCLYRGVVEGVDDTERRLRYRVRVVGIHGSAVPVDDLPWAEVCVFGGKFFGDLGHYEVGDPVMVAFEVGDDQRGVHGVIMGGMLTQSLGIDDLPVDMVDDYKRNRLRWIRRDRAGNVIEMSEVAGKYEIRIQSGSNEVFISQSEDRIVLRAPKGTVEVEALQCSVVASTVFADAKELTLNTNEEGVNVYAFTDLRLYARERVQIGQYTDVLGAPRQSDSADIQARNVKLGGGVMPSLTIEVTGIQSISLDSSGSVSVRAPVVNLGGNAQQVNIGGQSTANINIG